MCTPQQHPAEQPNDPAAVRQQFRQHLRSYILVISGLLLLNLVTSPHYLWFIWPLFGWGIGIVSHGLRTAQMPRFAAPLSAATPIEPTYPPITGREWPDLEA